MDESNGSNFVRLVLDVDGAGNFYAVGGIREPGEGDTKFIGLDRIRRKENKLSARVAELEAEVERLRGIIAKIANGLNTPFPFPETKSEHDDLLIRSAAEAGKALQKIGRILKEDWWTWSDLPKLVKAALREVDGGN